MKRWFILAAGLLMLLCLGTSQAWSVYVAPLTRRYALTSFQTQLVFATAVLAFCTSIIFSGRLMDRLGPRRVALSGALIIAVAYLTTWSLGDRYFFLWLGMGLFYGIGCATAYTCPIATAIRWFPRNPGLVAGLSAAAFGLGPIVVQTVSLALLGRGWHVLNVIGIIGVVYTPLLVLTSLALVAPAAAVDAPRAADFPRRTLLRDRRFWILFFGMLCGTFPYLLVMGNVKAIADGWHMAAVTGLAIPAVAVGNTLGRVFWGRMIDRAGTRRAMRGAQLIMIVCAAAFIFARGNSVVFLVTALGIGFSYGGNFSVFPATIARTYGAHVLGSIYPLVMFAQGISSSGPAVGGFLNDLTGSFVPGLAVGAAVAVAGFTLSALLERGARRDPWTLLEGPGG